MITTAKAMVECLLKEDVKVVFGYPGAAICPFYDALSYTDIKHILVRHEQNAGHAASGYARISKKPAVCIATSGPGALNLITAIATAYMDSIPLVVITGQVSSELLGRDVFQEADITGAVEPFVKHSYLVKSSKDIGRIFKEAFYISSTGRQGPVLIDVPLDIQKELIDFTYPQTVNIRSYKPDFPIHMGQLNRVISAIKASKRPLICAGGGVFSSNSEAELLSLSSKTNIPIVTTMMGISAVSPQYQNNLGMIGMHGNKYANRAVNSADLLILVGARVGDRAIMSPMGLSEKTTIVHIDIDPAEIGKNIDTNIPLVGDAKAILSSLETKLEDTRFENWVETCKPKSLEDIKPSSFITPHIFLKTLSNKLCDDAIIVADVGQNQIWTASSFNVKNGRFLTSGGMGTMGYSIPAAMGAKLADFGRQVISVCGDGSFQMQMMELATIKANDIPIKIIVMNNNRLGMVREVQDRQYKGNKTAVFLDGNPDFVKLIEAYSIKARKIFDDKEIDDALNELLSSKEPFLLECAISPEEATL